METGISPYQGKDREITFGADIIDAFPNVCFIIDRHARVLAVNSEARLLLGRLTADASQESFSLLLDDPSREMFRLSLAACFEEGTRQSLEALFKPGGDAAGKAVELSLSRYQPVTAEGKETVCLVVMYDISAMKQKDLELLRFSNVAHFTVNPIEITDPNGHIIYVNPAFEKASGYTKEELIGKNPNVFGSGKHPKSFWLKMWNTINAGKVWVGDVENRRRSGEAYFTQILISPIIGPEGEIVGYFGVHRDITEQRNLEQQLIHAQKMESIGLLAAGIAHEVGNPLTSISSLVQIIQRTTNDEFTQEKLELIKSQVSRISRIIRDLVDYSRRSSYEMQLTDINKSIREAVAIVRVGKKSKEIDFQLDLDPSLPQLQLVPDQIEQVFINILINAVDAIHSRELVAMPPGGPGGKPKGQVQIRTYLRDDAVQIAIQDNGKGIPASALPKIFEAFYTTKKVGEGTGLGLWVSYGIINSFKGTIKVDSIEGVGSTFTISLSLLREAPSQ